MDCLSLPNSMGNSPDTDSSDNESLYELIDPDQRDVLVLATADSSDSWLQMSEQQPQLSCDLNQQNTLDTVLDCVHRNLLEDKIAVKDEEIKELIAESRMNAQIADEFEEELEVFRRLYEDEAALREETFKKLTEEKKKNDEIIEKLNAKIVTLRGLHAGEIALREEMINELLTVRDEVERNEKTIDELQPQLTRVERSYKDEMDMKNLLDHYLRFEVNDKQRIFETVAKLEERWSASTTLYTEQMHHKQTEMQTLMETIEKMTEEKEALTITLNRLVTQNDVEKKRLEAIIEEKESILLRDSTRNAQDINKEQELTEKKKVEFKKLLITSKKENTKKMFNQTRIFIVLIIDMILSIAIAHSQSLEHSDDLVAVLFSLVRSLMFLCSALAWSGAVLDRASRVWPQALIMLLNFCLVLPAIVNGNLYANADLYALYLKSILFPICVFHMRNDTARRRSALSEHFEATFGIDDTIWESDSTVMETIKIEINKNKMGEMGFNLDTENIVDVVHSRSDAEQKGLRRGDKLVQINGINVTGMSRNAIETLFACINGTAALIVKRIVDM